MTIRPTQPADLEAILILEREASEAPHWPLATYAEILAQKYQPGYLRRQLFVAFAEETLVGFAVAKTVGPKADGSNAELESVAVAKTFRRQGIGRALCLAVIQWCREQGAESIELEVRAGSQSPRRLYEDLGFTATSSRSAYYRDPTEDAILMHLPLSPDATS